MAQPFDYSLNVPTPLEAGAQAFKLGAGIAAAEQEALAYKQAQQQKALEQQQAMEQERAASEAINAALDPNATPQQILRSQLFTKNKEQIEALANWGRTLDVERAKPMVNRLLMVAGPLAHNNPKVAIANLKREFAANEGNPAAQAEIQSRMDEIGANPAAAASRSMAELALLPGGDQAVSNLLKLTAETRAQLQEQRAAAQDIRQAEMQGWNIKKIQNDIGVSRLNAQIAAANAAASREGNTLKQQELLLKVQEMTDKRDQAVKARISEGESVVSSLQNTKSLLSDILSKENRGVLQTAVGASAFLAATPGTKARAMAGKIEQLQNSLAAVNLDKLKGAISDKDILFLKNIESNLDRYQNETAFINELNRISANLDQGIKRVASKYGMPEPEQAMPKGRPASRNITVDY